MRRRLTATVLSGVGLALVCAAGAAPLDRLLGVVDARTVAASDIALARALGAHGFTPSTDPITRADVERFVDVLLMLEEADRIGVAVEEAQIERAWAAVATRAGGQAALQRWLDAHAIEGAWVRRLLQADLRRVGFFEARFAAFVFPDEAAIAGRLGPGPPAEAAREQARQALAREAAERAQAEWLEAARKRAAILILLPDDAAVAPPFPPP
jgi:hypothetical protein